jgi:hypothetical protein
LPLKIDAACVGRSTASLKKKNAGASMIPSCVIEVHATPPCGFHSRRGNICVCLETSPQEYARKHAPWGEMPNQKFPGATTPGGQARDVSHNERFVSWTCINSQSEGGREFSLPQNSRLRTSSRIGMVCLVSSCALHWIAYVRLAFGPSPSAMIGATLARHVMQTKYARILSSLVADP